MKQILLFLNIFGVFVFAAQDSLDQTGIYLEQNIKSSGMNMPQPADAITKSWISDQKVRIEQPGQVLIIDFDLKKIFTLMQNEKEYIEMSFKEMDQILNLSKMFMQGNGADLSFTATDKKKLINSWRSYEIEGKGEQQRIQMWLSRDIKIERDIIFKMYNKMPGMSFFAESFQKTLTYPGFPVWTKIEMPVMGMDMTTMIELLKVEERNFNDDLFRVPKDYKQIDNPLKNMENN